MGGGQRWLSMVLSVNDMVLKLLSGPWVIPRWSAITAALATLAPGAMIVVERRCCGEVSQFEAGASWSNGDSHSDLVSETLSTPPRSVILRADRSKVSCYVEELLVVGSADAELLRGHSCSHDSISDLLEGDVTGVVG